LIQRHGRIVRDFVGEALHLIQRAAQRLTIRRASFADVGRQDDIADLEARLFG
jgi:hypothetical protein